MYIEPNTNIRLLKNVPLDNTYDHTVYFTSATAQASYFIGLQKYNLTGYTYQRVQRGKARVGIVADLLYDCNYMMFQNTNFGSKWFYAFITGVEYVNNQCSDISFEIDVLQTWFFDYTPDYCFVERQHTITDNLGEHFEPEGLETGEYVFNDGYQQLSSAITPMCVIIMVCDTAEAPEGTLYDGVYGGCTLFAYNSDDTETIQNKINSYVQKPDAIVGMYMCPVLATGQAIPEGGLQLAYSSGGTVLNGSADPITKNMTLDGYTPKNMKLLTYPYNFFHIDNASGQELNLRYEFFTSLQPKWKINIPVTMPIQCMLRPTNYKNSGDTTLNNETLILGNYPMCSWSTDAFRAWLAQNSIPMISNVVNGAVQGAMNPTTGGGVVGAGVGVAGAVAGILAQGYSASISADISKGNISNGSGNVSAGTQSFYGGRCSITAEYAKMIDNYFDMFGYSVRRLVIPNRNSRPHWNYVKTLGCTITGSVPADDMRKICSIYDKGITFWKNGAEIGNYALDNRPT